MAASPKRKRRISQHERALGAAIRKRNKCFNDALKATFELADVCSAIWWDFQLGRQPREEGIAERLSIQEEFDALLAISVRKHIRKFRRLLRDAHVLTDEPVVAVGVRKRIRKLRCLPLDTYVLGKLCQMDDSMLKAAAESGLLGPFTQREDILSWQESHKRAAQSIPGARK